MRRIRAAVTASAFREEQCLDELPPLVPVSRPSSAIFDIPIDLARPSELLRTVSGWADVQETRRVMYVNAHVVNQSRATTGLGRALRRADLVYCDGYGVRLAARVLNLPVPHRMSGPGAVSGRATRGERSG